MIRTLLYYLHDEDDIVDAYNIQTLRALRPYFAHIAVVFHGQMSAEAEALLAPVSDRRIQRDWTAPRNQAIHQALRMLLDDGQAQGELVLLDNMAMGPISPMEALFARTEAMDADIVTYWYYNFFVLLKESVVQSDALGDFLRRNTNDDPVKALQAAGFRHASLLEDEAISVFTGHPFHDLPVEMARSGFCPFFLRDIFYKDYEKALETTAGQCAHDLYRHLQQTGFDTGPLWEALLRTQHQLDLYMNLHLLYVVDSHKSLPRTQKSRVALVLHLYYADLLESSLAYARAVSPDTDVYITTDTQAKKQKIEQTFAILDAAHIEVRVIPNRGRDVSALLVGVKDIVSRYDYICFSHDKKVLQTNPATVGEGFAARAWENILGSRATFENIARLFDENPRLGMLSPPPPNHADYFFTLALDWGPNYERTRALAEALGYDGPISEGKMPIAPLGTCFWFRTSALASLYERDWQYADFPEEPNNADGTILHALERYYPFAAQRAGYYPAYVLADTHARVEYTNLKAYVRGFNLLEIKRNYTARFHSMVGIANFRLSELPELREAVQALEARNEQMAQMERDLREGRQSAGLRAVLSYKARRVKAGLKRILGRSSRE